MAAFGFNLLAFIFAIVLLIVFHEFGHFYVAKKLGVKVLRFSVGFGKPLWGYAAKDGTEYVLSMIPLGGYVKMLDDSEQEVPEDLQRYAFNRQSLPKRLAIVLAGPVFNILFAILAYYLVFCIGVKTVVPMVGETQPGSIAARAGLVTGEEIIAIDGQKTPTWQRVNIALMHEIGNQRKVTITTKTATGAPKKTILDLSDWTFDERTQNVIAGLGIQPYIPPIPPIVAKVMADSPAQKAGIQPGDKILTIDDKGIKDWNQMGKYIRVHPNKTHELRVRRGAKVLRYTVKPMQVKGKNGQKIAVIGVKPLPFAWPSHMIRTERYSIFSAIWPAIQRTTSTLLLSFAIIGKLLVGKLSISSLSGPVGIAVGAGQSASLGFMIYLHFLALVSISLAVINLLPIPMLDGGHILFYVIEGILGRPLSVKAQTQGMQVGLILLVSLMIIALYNDITRLW